MFRMLISWTWLDTIAAKAFWTGRGRQDNDQCTRAAADPGIPDLRRREGRRDTHGHHTGAARNGQLPALAAVAATRRRDRPPRTRLRRWRPGDSHDRPGRAVLARDQHRSRPPCHLGQALRPARRPGHPPRAHRGGTLHPLPVPRLKYSSPTPRRPAPDYTTRPRPSTPRTSRLPSRSQRPSRAKASPNPVPTRMAIRPRFKNHDRSVPTSVSREVRTASSPRPQGSNYRVPAQPLSRSAGSCHIGGQLVTCTVGRWGRS